MILGYYILQFVKFRIFIGKKYINKYILLEQISTILFKTTGCYTYRGHLNDRLFKINYIIVLDHI